MTFKREASIRRRMCNPGSVVETIYELLKTGHPAKRAAGILLLKEYAAHLAANEQGERASTIVDWFRDNDPLKKARPEGVDRIIP